MENRSQIKIIVILYAIFFFTFNVLNAQCYYTKKRKVINDSCKTYIIKSDFEKGLENLPKMGNLNQLIIENGDIPIIISDSMLKNEIYVIYMGKICNDTIFKKVKVLVDLTYDFDTFRSDILNSNTLKRLTVRGLNKSINFNMKDTNYTIKSLYLISIKEYFLDSSYLLFKNLITFGGSFNPFRDSNILIIQKLNKNLHLWIEGVDFRGFSMENDSLCKLRTRVINFNKCKFTRKQKKLIKQYGYFRINSY